jgi:8-oxo-dGTP pyrophosphatase MutT (NUDIX family)
MGKPSFNNCRCFGGIIKCTSTNKYLLVKGKSKWSFPKGHRELNETAYSCAKREIYEETGLVFEDIEFKSRTFVSLYYYFNILVDTELPVNPIDNEEISEAKWLSLEEIMPLDKNKDVDVFFTKLSKN